MKILYKIKSGSHLYGLTTPTSDIDYVGVYIPDTLGELIDPFDSTDEIDMSVKSKLENGKNAKDAIDEKYYHINKFLKLCAENNPNIFEMLFAPEDCIEYVDPDFKSLILDHPEMFINAKLIARFIGYAKSQEQKSYTKSDNYIKLAKFKEMLEYKITRTTNNDHVSMIERIYNPVEKRIALGYSDGGIVTEKIVKHSPTNIETIFEVGDMSFPSGLSTKEAIARIEDRFARASHRIEGIFINKYEPKFLSHTVRLLSEGIQLLVNGRIDFPFTGKDHEVIMNIKLGLTPIEDIPSIINKYKEQLGDLEMHVTLPKTADYDAIKNAYLLLVVSMYNREMSELAEDYESTIY